MRPHSCYTTLWKVSDLNISTPGSPTTTLATTTTSAASCPSVIAVTFNEVVTTAVGQTIKIAGNNAQFGNWDAASAIVLSASKYTSSNPVWYVTLNMAPGTVLQYKYIKVESSGVVTWEADPNRSFTVPACVASAVVNNSWQ